MQRFERLLNLMRDFLSSLLDLIVLSRTIKILVPRWLVFIKRDGQIACLR